MQLEMRVNGELRRVEAHPMSRLLDVLREGLQLCGTKEGCGEGECGACSVLLDGELVNSCMVPALQAHGHSVVTIEGVAPAPGVLDRVQQAFIDCGGAQCGICTPGMVLAAQALLREHPQPTEAQIRQGLSGNLCRCTGYVRIFDAVVRACQAGAETAGGGR